MDVGKNSSLGDCYASQEFVQLFVVSDGELDVARSDTRSLVVLGSISSELEKLGCQILKDSSHVDGRSRTDTLGESPLTEVSRHAADGELETRLS